MAVAEDYGGGENRRADYSSSGGKYIGSAALERAGDEVEEEDVAGGCGLDYGIGPWHIRILVDNPFEGGGGYTPREVGEMTPDQIWFRLCSIDFFKSGRVREASAEDMRTLVDDDGLIKGRLADGTPVRLPLRVDGRTTAQRAAQAAEEANKKRGRRGRRKRGT